MNNRCLKLLSAMEDLSIDAFLITDTVNLRYFTGFTGSAGYALFGKNHSILVTDFRYTEQAEKQAKDFKVYDISDFSLSSFVNDKIRVGFENRSISYIDYCGFSKDIKNLVCGDNILEDIRSIKDPYEISLIQKAASISDMAFEHILSFIKQGVTEKDVATELEFFMRKNGADALSFEPIVATGKRGAMPHAHPENNILQNGDLVVLDYGCMCDGYCSDMTRTIAVGDISPFKLEVYETVKKVQAKCLSMVKPGAICSDIHNYSYKVLNDKYKDCYGHGLGHGVGLKIHESPSLNSRFNKALVPGNIVTVEPGVYITGECGVRIEDLVLITEDGCTILSKSTKELVKI